MTRTIPLVVTILCGAQMAFADSPLSNPLPNKLPLSGSAPAKLVPDLCLLRYRISTDSADCQAHFDQGLAYFYSYVWGSAAQSFETAAFHDPDCAMAWWGLSRAFDRAGKPELALKALDKAREKQGHASHREQFLIKALLAMPPHKPLPADATAATRQEAQKLAETQRQVATRTVDEMLSLYEDDEEGWFFRAQLAGGGVSSVPFYKALLRINPLHPGGTHDLVHYYDNTNRWALAWPYTENYIKGSPGISHAYHMQIDHVALHLGRWDKVIEHAPRAGESGLLMLALTHDGRFVEARKVGDRKSVNRFYLHLAERSWDDAQAVLDALGDGDKPTLSYLTALLHLKQDRPDLAAPSVEALQTAPEKNPKTNRGQLENWQMEAEGVLLCQQGDIKPGLALLAKVRERTKDSHKHMGWAYGAYYDEIYGTAALRSGQEEIAEEALLHALAHDSGSVRGALGMQILCERQGRDEEAKRFRDLAGRIWQKADLGALDAELAYLRKPFGQGSTAKPAGK